MERNRFGGGQRFVPVREGDELDVTIEAVGEKGDGIAKKDGFVLFVPNAKEGDTVRVKVSKVLRKVGFADIVGEAKEAPAQDKATKEESTAEPADEAGPEDSEDFGEEDSEEAKEDAEEVTEEEPEAEEEPAVEEAK
ncbi:TRAM domain-containing protein, partial [Candidatus Woesearchaeota archaeon]|nr:TRAM domain-containing protein [Candidatus Woesearchaeota archaeon]